MGRIGMMGSIPLGDVLQMLSGYVVCLLFPRYSWSSCTSCEIKSYVFFIPRGSVHEQTSQFGKEITRNPAS